jgi:hypothetical protein
VNQKRGKQYLAGAHQSLAMPLASRMGPLN